MKEREYFADNIKAIAMYLVVLSHCFMPINNVTNVCVVWLYNSFFYFHLSLFFYISGIYAKFSIKNIFTKLLYPYLIFQIIFILFAKFGNLSFVNHLYPIYSLWFLLALSIYMFTVPLLNRINRGLTKCCFIIATIVVALIFGYVPLPDCLGVLSRIICMYPFFVIGVLYKNFRLHKYTKHLLYKIIAIVLSLGLFICTYFIFGTMDMDMIFYRSYSYAPIIYRITRYLFTFIGSISLLILVPNERRWYSSYGARTKTTYLYHIFPAIFLSVSYNKITKDISKIFIMLVLAGLICLITGSKWFDKGVKYTTQFPQRKSYKINTN